MSIEKDISSIYKILILYENIENKENLVDIDSYLNYIDRLYVYWVGVGEQEIYTILKGLWLLGTNVTHKRVKSMVFHMIDIIKKRSN